MLVLGLTVAFTIDGGTFNLKILNLWLARTRVVSALGHPGLCGHCISFYCFDRQFDLL